MNTPDPEARRVLRKAGLHYVNDQQPGISRKKRGASWVYVDPKGNRVRKPSDIERIRKLAIPPAYKDVWICRDPKGHLQAVGRDARGRKQYRYHPDWRTERDSGKFERMIAFAKALPKMRRRANRDLKRPGLPREKVLATVVRLLEKTLIRVGNDEYARTNKSYGLTTLRDHHAKVKGAEVRFEFTGKHGIRHKVELNDARLARIVKKCQELPGQEIFQYVDEDGKRHDVKSDDVNAYLTEIGGEDFTAKDFRTWAGTLLAAEALQEYQEFSSTHEAKKQVLKAIESVSRRLGNTKTICRKCYIHPVVLEAHLDGSLAKILHDRATQLMASKLKDLKREEAAILVLLEKRLRIDSRGA